MKKIVTLLGLVFGLITGCQNKVIEKSPEEIMDNRPAIYNYKVTDINGGEFDFASLKGKRILVVNTASKCGLTPQYKDLQVLYDTYKDQNFVIVGFPANDFMSQEPGTNDEIVEFCQMNYGVTFPMMSKISVKGDSIAPIYQFLTQESLNGFADSSVEWNFQKYLINENGQLEKVVGPRINPLDKEITSWIEK